MSIDELFKYINDSPNLTDDQIEDAIARVDDPTERQLAHVSAWEFWASLPEYYQDRV